MTLLVVNQHQVTSVTPVDRGMYVYGPLRSSYHVLNTAQSSATAFRKLKHK